MTVDYDLLRAVDLDVEGERVGGALEAGGPAVGVGLDLEAGGDEPLELPAADVAYEELLVRVLPRQADEFTCTGCFLVQHKSRIARGVGDGALCPECA
jgi:hypothetical protein